MTFKGDKGDLKDGGIRKLDRTTSQTHHRGAFIDHRGVRGLVHVSRGHPDLPLALQVRSLDARWLSPWPLRDIQQRRGQLPP
ncbi:MAG: hypothetical protein OES32_01935 [Acidobacteriota bacterium]|nr:hypothetical protein [Acidobacteriota bacterium]